MQLKLINVDKISLAKYLKEIHIYKFKRRDDYRLLISCYYYLINY